MVRRSWRRPRPAHASIGGSVDAEERHVDVGGVVAVHASESATMLGRIQRRDDRRRDLRCADGVRRGQHVERDIGAAAHADHVRCDARPAAQEPSARLVLGRVAGAAKMFDVQVLHIAAEVREAPRHMRIAADDDERRAGQRETRDIERAIRGVQRGFVPDVRHAKREVHVVRNQRQAAGTSASPRRPSCSIRSGSLRTFAARASSASASRSCGDARWQFSCDCVLVQRHLLDLRPRAGEVGHALRRRMIAPRAHRVKVGQQLRRQMREKLSRSILVGNSVERSCVIASATSSESRGVHGAGV